MFSIRSPVSDEGGDTGSMHRSCRWQLTCSPEDFCFDPNPLHSPTETKLELQFLGLFFLTSEFTIQLQEKLRALLEKDPLSSLLPVLGD